MSNENNNFPIAQQINSSKYILVVEDDVALRFALSEWLRSLMYTVYEAANADEAIIVTSSSITVDLVITDVDMPGKLNGFDLVDHLRQTSPGMKIVVVSGKAEGSQAKERSVSFFRKPYDFQTLALFIETLIPTIATESDDE